MNHVRQRPCLPYRKHTDPSHHLTTNRVFVTSTGARVVETHEKHHHVQLCLATLTALPHLLDFGIRLTGDQYRLAVIAYRGISVHTECIIINGR